MSFDELYAGSLPDVLKSDSDESKNTDGVSKGADGQAKDMPR